MTRTLSTPNSDAFQADALAPVIFVEFDFSGYFARLFNGIGTLSWGGRDFVGAGTLLAMSAVEETQTVESTNVTVTISSIPSALIATAYGTFSQGRSAKIWIGAFNPDTGALVDTPVQMFAGRLDTISDLDSGQTATIVISCENHLADLQRANARYYTNEDQKRVFSVDESLRFIPALQEKTIAWGKPGPDSPTSASSQGGRSGIVQR